ncbi:hypothetical protein AGMMS49950_07250 [Endomicrobiia bacterium]|nr:hypothetical protein AGMMS49531_09730 [Endomicrobiia bacterium]GHT62080.1 hypothetical protein AGMMS49531_09770 [Endomicrobiia bacterium]GHT71142.1 hypothetical protein AGMMS49950_07250 [Endomicrobiia bacterium]
MRKTKLLNSSSFILLGFLVLSSCDKKNALLVNRRTATPERVKEIKAKEEELEKELEGREKQWAEAGKAWNEELRKVLYKHEKQGRVLAVRGKAVVEACRELEVQKGSGEKVQEAQGKLEEAVKKRDEERSRAEDEARAAEKKLLEKTREACEARDKAWNALDDARRKKRGVVREKECLEALLEVLKLELEKREKEWVEVREEALEKLKKELKVLEEVREKELEEQDKVWLEEEESREKEQRKTLEEERAEAEKKRLEKAQEEQRKNAGKAAGKIEKRVKSTGRSTKKNLEDEKAYRKAIAKETYGPVILPIVHNGENHFWYKSPSDTYVPGDCALYAVVRLLHHAGQRGIVDKNLWKKSNQELRTILADQLRGSRESHENVKTHKNGYILMRFLYCCML